MAHSPSALKRWRQNERRRARNKAVRSAIRTEIKKARTVIATTSEGDARPVLAEAEAALDRAARRHVIHPNTAARHKSRLMRRMNAQATAPQAEAEAPKRGRKTAAKKTTRKTAAKKTSARKKST